MSKHRRFHHLLVRHAFYPLAMLTLLGFAFLVVRVVRLGSWRYRFLVWNLFLAWLPYGFAMLTLAVRDRFPRDRWLTAALGAAWLVTLPNAPYIATDFVHLMNHPVPWWWFDLGLILTFALAGGFLGLVSIDAMHGVVRRRAGGVVGWAFVLAVTVLCGFGIYLGRFLRFNSWDVVMHPSRLVRHTAEQILADGDNGKSWGVTGMFATLFLGCYAVLAAGYRGHHPPDDEPGAESSISTLQDRAPVEIVRTPARASAVRSDSIVERPV